MDVDVEIRDGRESDLTAIERIFREVGWITDDGEATTLPHFLADAATHVATIAGEAECAVSTHTGSMVYDRTDVPAAIVTSVTTSRVARRLGLARRLTGRALVAAAEAGAAWSLLGMFDQGFYDRLGFGSGSTLLRHQLDPASLTVPVPTRRPVRVTVDDVEEAWAAQQARQRHHGGVTVDSPAFLRGEMGWSETPMGLGFRDDEGRLTHWLWAEAKGEHGPYEYVAFVYATDEQLMDLLGLVRMLGDQVRLAWLPEPPGVVLADLVDQPERQRWLTKTAAQRVDVTGGTWWQARVLDVPTAVAARTWTGEPLRFALSLDDPLAAEEHGSWDAVHGDWVVELAEDSTATRGDAGDLPVLRSGVPAFSRMLLGVAPATTLRRTTDLDAPDDLLARLDDALRLPTPQPGMFF